MKQYNVRMWVGSNPTNVIVAAFNSAAALSTARKLYPSARIINAIQI